jgi:hypothetical protein
MPPTTRATRHHDFPRFHRRGAALRVLLAAAWLWTSGCTALREVPRAEYATRAERKHVRVETREGERFEFDVVQFSADSLTGTRRLDTDGSFEQVDEMVLPLERVAKLEARRVDWYRTGLVGGVALAAVLAAALSQAGDNGGGSGGGPGPCGPRGCP